MNTTAKAHEPTMEEILASIRRIISDDEPAPTNKGAAPVSPAAKPAAEPAPAEAAAADLGQDDIDAMFASFDGPEPEAAPEPKPEPAVAKEPAPAKPQPKIELDADVDVLELTDDMATEARFTPAPPPPPRPVTVSPPPPSPAPSAGERLTSPGTEETVGAAFNSLAHTILSNNARTIDDVVKEMLRPMLKQWLDDNLPPLVERLVRAEIERVARGGR